MLHGYCTADMHNKAATLVVLVALLVVVESQFEVNVTWTATGVQSYSARYGVIDLLLVSQLKLLSFGVSLVKVRGLQG